MSNPPPPQKNDESPINEGRSFKQWLKKLFHRAREPDDATGKIPLRPTYFRPTAQSVKPFPPRTLTFGLPFLRKFHLHFNGTRQGQAKGWHILGNWITWSQSSAREYRLRKLATRQLIRDIKAADGAVKPADPRTASSNFGVEWVNNITKALRQNPYFQWGRGKNAGMVNPLTMEFINQDAGGRPYNPDDPYTDPLGNSIAYGPRGDVFVGGPAMDPNTYRQMGLAYGQMGGMNNQLAGPFGQLGTPVMGQMAGPMTGQMNSPYAQMTGPFGQLGTPVGQVMGPQYGPPYDPNNPYIVDQYATSPTYGGSRRRQYVPNGYDPSLVGPMGLQGGSYNPYDPYLAAMANMPDPRMADPQMWDPRLAMLDQSGIYSGSRGSPDQDVGGGRDPSSVLDSPLSGRSFSPGVGRSLFD